MHCHCEVIMPATDDVEAALASIMGPFSEEKPDDVDEDDWSPGHGFWDYYVIGGRWAGAKREAAIGKDRIAAFYDWCQSEDIKVRNVTMGKQTIATPEMRERVDAKWREMFPGTYDTCPLFDHANDQLGLRGESWLDGDVAKFRDVPPALTCERVIFAGPSYNHADSGKPFVWTGPPKATFMLARDAWNGVNHMPVTWDGTLTDALAQFEKARNGYRGEYRAAITPREDWIVVTVDYHS